MNHVERQKVLLKIFEVAMFYGKEMTKEQIGIFVDVLHKHFQKTPAMYLAAFDDYMRDPNNKFFPAPAQLTQYLNPKASKVDVAVEMTRLLIRVIKSKQHSWTEGYWSAEGNYWIGKGKTYKSWKEAALDEVGPLGVSVIERYGWRNMCDAYFSASAYDEGTFAAQLREFIRARLNIIELGAEETMTQLPETRQVVNQIAQTITKDLNGAIGWKEERPAGLHTLSAYPDDDGIIPLVEPNIE